MVTIIITIVIIVIIIVTRQHRHYDNQNDCAGKTTEGCLHQVGGPPY